MKQNKKFIALAMIIFLIFMAFGKYQQTIALADIHTLYATDVIDKQTGERVTFEIRRSKDDTYQVKNTSTGRVYETKDVSKSGSAVRITLPDDQGDIVIKKNLNPASDPTVNVENSKKYKQVEGSSRVTKDSTTASEKSADTSSSTTTSEKITKVELTKENEEKVISQFGDWLFNSQYAKDSVVTRSKYGEILAVSNPSIAFLMAKTSDGQEIMTRLQRYIQGSLNDLPDTDIYVDGKASDKESLLSQKDSLDLTLLGNDLTSDQAQDYQSTAVFRLYTLKDKTHQQFASATDESSRLINKDELADDQNTMAGNFGYNDLYDTQVDHSKDSYEILLATDGTVYLTKDYWYESKALDYTYEKAPEDMQDAYQNLIKKYAESTSHSQSTDSQTQSNIFPTDLIGKWEGDAGAQGTQTMEYKKDGTVIKTIKSSKDTYQAKVTKVEKVSDNLYRFADGEDIGNALPTLGLGGAGFDAEYGFKLNDDGTLTYVQWTGPLDSAFDASTYKYSEFDDAVFKKTK